MTHFTPDNFVDGAGGNTPITAAKLNNVEGELAWLDAAIAEIAPGAAGSRVIPASKVGDLSATYTPAVYFASKLQKFHAALAARATSECNILVTGDSIGEGQGAGNIAKRWQALVQARMRSLLQPTGVAGAAIPYLSAAFATASITDYPVTTTGTTATSTVAGLGHRSMQYTGSNAQQVFSFTGTGFDIVWVQNSSGGRFDYSVDGGAATMVDTYGAATIGGKKTSVRGLAQGSHTVTLTVDATNARTPWIEGLVTYNQDESAGIRFYDDGHYGYDTGSIISTGFGALADYQASLTALGPFSLAIIAIGTNDATEPQTAATYGANVQTMITNLRATGFSGSILLLHYYKGQAQDPTLWAAYMTQLQTIAAGDPDIAALDLTRMMPPIPNPATAASSLGLYSDANHPTPAGHQRVADIVLSAIMPNPAF